MLSSAFWYPNNLGIWASEVLRRLCRRALNNFMWTHKSMFLGTRTLYRYHSYYRAEPTVPVLPQMCSSALPKKWLILNASGEIEKFGEIYILQLLMKPPVSYTNITSKPRILCSPRYTCIPPTFPVQGVGLSIYVQ